MNPDPRAAVHAWTYVLVVPIYMVMHCNVRHCCAGAYVHRLPEDRNRPALRRGLIVSANAGHGSRVNCLLRALCSLAIAHACTPARTHALSACPDFLIIFGEVRCNS
jgi:hypothetical protein